MTEQDAVTEAVAWAKSRYGPQVRPLKRGGGYDAERLSLGHYWRDAVSRWEIAIAYRARGGHERRMLVEVVEYQDGGTWTQAVGGLSHVLVSVPSVLTDDTEA